MGGVSVMGGSSLSSAASLYLLSPAPFRELAVDIANLIDNLLYTDIDCPPDKPRSKEDEVES